MAIKIIIIIKGGSDGINDGTFGLQVGGPDLSPN